PNRMEVYATDSYFNRIEIPWEHVTINAINDPDGRWIDNYFHASRPGFIIFEASFGGMFARQEIEARRMLELAPSVETFVLEVGQSRGLSFQGIDHTGTRSGNLPGVNFRISNPELGYMQGNTFTATAPGVGYVQAWVGDVVRHVTFAVREVQPEPEPRDEDYEGEEEPEELPEFVPDFSGLLVPPDSRFTDFTRRDLSGEAPYGSFDIVAVGRTAVPDADDLPQGFAVADAAARALFTQGSSRGLLVGEADWADDVGPVYRWNSDYHVHRQYNTVILQMSAAEGGFFRTNRQQWNSFSGDIAASGAQHVIVMTDVNPLTGIPAGELGLFTEVMAEFVNMGMSVFVVSAHGESTSATARDGVRYINLGRMWTGDNRQNNSFAMLRIRITDDQAVYDLQTLN
ncbi:MAG: hypothetical protein FWD96_03100, partial [Defluviitaleaceae bacterium]|nr:hypothetical protein [Defluviitaleaceae bacterium]